jgi:phosphonate transport system substrate-binding protein
MKKILGLFIMVIIGLFLLIGCGQKQELPKISLDKVESNLITGENSIREEPLRVAIAAVISAKESIIYYEDLLKLLEQSLNRPIEIVQRKTYGEINDLLRVGQVDIAFVCTYAYILGNDEFGMKLLVAPQVNGKPTYQNYIIVPKNSPVEKLEDLKGKRFAFTDPISFTGRLYPMYMLLQMGFTPEAFFDEVIFTYSHDNSIKAVAQNLVDGAAIDGLILEYLYTIDQAYLNKVKVIHKSDNFGIPPVVTPSGIDPELKIKLREFFTTLHLDEANYDLMDKLQIERFVIPDEKNYDSIRTIVRAVLNNEK